MLEESAAQTVESDQESDSKGLRIKDKGDAIGRD